MEFSTQQPVFSSLKALWDGITVEYGCRNTLGEFDVFMPKHSISVAFSPHDRVTWSIDGASSQTTALPPGSVFLFSSHDFVWHYRERKSEYIHMMLDAALLNQVASECGLTTNVEIEQRVIFADPTILQVAQLFKSEVFNDGGLARKLYTESLRNLLAVHLLRNYSGSVVKPAVQDIIGAHQIKQLKDFIEDRLAEGLTIADMADVVHMSQFHFARAFKAAIGESPHRYLTQRRMERARVLLSVTRLSVAEVAQRVGFANKSHFLAQFRKATGMTPKAYRDCF